MEESGATPHDTVTKVTIGGNQPLELLPRIRTRRLGGVLGIYYMHSQKREPDPFVALNHKATESEGEGEYWTRRVQRL